MEINDLGTLFDANAFLDEDGDLRLKLTYLNKEDYKIITTGKVSINEVNLIASLSGDNKLNVNSSISPDKFKNLFTIETFK